MLHRATVAAALPEGSPRIQRFIEKWTLKEAFVKATGRGLKGSTNNFSIGAGAPSNLPSQR